jgi:Autochaperone Domain Type 1
MGRLHRRKGILHGGECCCSYPVLSRPVSLGRAKRGSLLAGTALASTLLLGSIAVPSSASAQQAVFIPASPFPVTLTNNKNCVFLGTCALINTFGIAASIDFTNTGNFAVAGPGALGISTNTAALLGSIKLNNSGNIATAGLGAIGISANTVAGLSPVEIVNSGDIATAGLGAIGISATTTLLATHSPISITNSGDLATAGYGAIGINALTTSNASPIEIVNGGDIATTGATAVGVLAQAYGQSSNVTIDNTASITTKAHDAHGINALTTSSTSPIEIINNGNIATFGAAAIGAAAIGVYAQSYGRNSDVCLVNNGGVSTQAHDADGINGYTSGRYADLKIVNNGDILTHGLRSEGIYATVKGRNAALIVENRGAITTKGALADGIDAFAYGRNDNLLVVNSGHITTSGRYTAEIVGGTSNTNSPLTIRNTGSVHADGAYGYGIAGVTYGASSPVQIENSGDAYGSYTGIFSFSNASTKIINRGSISAGNNLAIDTVGASTTIENAGLVTGFVDLTDSADAFINQKGGEFHAMGTSDFRSGSDVLFNEPGGTVRVASASNKQEITSIVGLERFENRGLINMQDGSPDDVFRISNTVGGTDASFNGGSGSILAVDTYIGRQPKSDIVIVDGDVSGTTRLEVHNTNTGGGRFQPVGIPVVFAEGKSVPSNAFYLDKPIDAGFFDYDLFFRPTGSGGFELKSMPGGDSHVVPHLETITHDIFNSAAETWFDQSTDLRVLLERGVACNSSNRPANDIECQQASFTPGVWVRGSGNWFDQDASATTHAYGRTYHHDLGSNLEVMDFESGIDFGKPELFAPHDILVFGILGGAVDASLNYKTLARQFDVSGGEAGAYATHLNGGLFVDTLFKAHFLTLDPKDVQGFPDTLAQRPMACAPTPAIAWAGLGKARFSSRWPQSQHRGLISTISPETATA